MDVLHSRQLWRLASLLSAVLPALTLATLLVPYSVGVARGSLRPLLPTISEAGMCPLTAPLFGWLASGAAVAGAVCSLSLAALLQRRGESARWSRAVLVLGLVGAVATALAAGARLDRHRSVHLSAVAVLGVTGGAMCLLLAALTPHSQPRLRLLRWGMLVAAAALVAAFTGAQLAKPVGYHELQLRADAACNATELWQLGWRPGTTLFTIQLVTATSEWSCLLLLSLFVATFSDELRRQPDDDPGHQLLG